MIVATGSIEQPTIFRNNDLPGIMLGGAAQRLIRHYGVRPGQKAVVLATTDEGYCVALDLVEAGVSVMLVTDPRSGGETGTFEAQLHSARGHPEQQRSKLPRGQPETATLPGPRRRALDRLRPADCLRRPGACLAPPCQAGAKVAMTPPPDG